MTECRQTNVPSVDNTQPDCQEVIKEQCVVATKKRTTPIEISTGEPLESILDKILMEIRDIKQSLGMQ